MLTASSLLHYSSTSQHFSLLFTPYILLILSFFHYLLSSNLPTLLFITIIIIYI
jgi:hypothetical protein